MLEERKGKVAKHGVPYSAFHPSKNIICLFINGLMSSNKSVSILAFTEDLTLGQLHRLSSL